jgi:hypothetical protein
MHIWATIVHYKNLDIHVGECANSGCVMMPLATYVNAIRIVQ